jgi:hypothetical protein
MELLTTLGAAAAGLLAGALWFDALSLAGPRARIARAVTLSAGLGAAPAPLAVVAALLAALVLGQSFTLGGVARPLEGALWGAAAGAAVMTPWALAAALAGRRAPCWPEVVAAALSLAATGAVLGLRSVSP